MKKIFAVVFVIVTFHLTGNGSDPFSGGIGLLPGYNNNEIPLKGTQLLAFTTSENKDLTNGQRNAGAIVFTLSP